MILPAYKRIYYTDFPKDSQPAMEQLSYTVNNAFEGIFSALNNGLNLSDNLAVSVKDITVNVDANGNPLSTLSFSIANTNTISGVQVIRALNQTNNSVFPTTAPWITYTQNGNKIIINNITGIPVGNTFLVRVIAYLT
jgi:hypothetical protein